MGEAEDARQDWPRPFDFVRLPADVQLNVVLLGSLMDIVLLLRPRPPHLSLSPKNNKIYANIALSQTCRSLREIAFRTLVAEHSTHLPNKADDLTASLPPHLRARFDGGARASTGGPTAAGGGGGGAWAVGGPIIACIANAQRRAMSGIANCLLASTVAANIATDGESVSRLSLARLVMQRQLPTFNGPCETFASSRRREADIRAAAQSLIEAVGDRGVPLVPLDTVLFLRWHAEDLQRILSLGADPSDARASATVVEEWKAFGRFFVRFSEVPPFVFGAIQPTRKRRPRGQRQQPLRPPPKWPSEVSHWVGVEMSPADPGELYLMNDNGEYCNSFWIREENCPPQLLVGLSRNFGWYELMVACLPSTESEHAFGGIWLMDLKFVGDPEGGAAMVTLGATEWLEKIREAAEARVSVTGRMITTALVSYVSGAIYNE
ncbi:hypothetical protein HK405_003345 [Cladochytrium tenue]|nr:hypothetical protein HK405_003345 [Cladochytrium tenue]